MVRTHLISTLLLVSNVEASAFTPPASIEAWRAFLVGQWTLRKAMNFRDGGLSGRFQGSATFLPFAQNVLGYNESGTFTPKEGGTERETRNSLLYDCSAPDVERIEVFYDLATDRSSPEAIVSGAKFLYAFEPLEPGTLSIKETQQGDDTYSGELEVSAPDAFLLTWRVRGTRQNGEILSLYSRSDDQVL